MEIGSEEMQRLAGAYWNEHTLQLEVRGGKLYFRDQGAWYLKSSEWALVRKAGENRYIQEVATSASNGATSTTKDSPVPQGDPTGLAFSAVVDHGGQVQYIRMGSRVFHREP